MQNQRGRMHTGVQIRGEPRRVSVRVAPQEPGGRCKINADVCIPASKCEASRDASASGWLRRSPGGRCKINTDVCIPASKYGRAEMRERPGAPKGPSMFISPGTRPPSGAPDAHASRLASH